MKHHYTDPHGVTHTWETPDTLTPLEGVALIATLNAVLGIWTLEEASNISSTPQQDLIAEAQAWAVAKEQS